jgi:hypothetical protein
MRISQRLLAVLAFVLAGGAVAWAGITGSISGIVTDPSNSVIPGATVMATNLDTGVQASVKTDGAGFYSFPDLPIGNYDVDVTQTGFKTYHKSGIHIDANSAIRADVKLEIGQVAEKVTVTSSAVQVQTQSTQMGEVIDSNRMESVPLNGRSFVDLLSLQPGVVPGAYSEQAAGLNDRAVSGGLGSGNISINGGREASNGFMINGANVNEGKNNGTAAIPNLDSIEEFRIITNNFDPEYGNYSGGQVNVVTKNGTNQFHGDVFEFNRNTDLNAINYFADSKGKFIQNQFGGTVGGPIKRDKVFFFGDYQGTRQIIGSTDQAIVPTAQDRTGDLSDGTFQTMSGFVNSDSLSNPDSWANVLSGRLGYEVDPGEPYYFGGCTTHDTATGCVFPNQFIPTTAWSSAATGLLPYIPKATILDAPPNNPNFNTSAYNDRLRDDKLGARIDFNTHWGMISGYYHFDDANVDSAYPNGGANVPGFNGTNLTRAQVITLSDTKSIGSTSVNEFRLSYLRDANHLFTPKGGLGPSLTSLGFPGGFDMPGGLGPIQADLEGVPNVCTNEFCIGVPTDTTQQFNNTYQIADNFTKIIGTHSIKFGGQFHYDQINDRNFYGEDGSFSFGGGETGSDFADFLIGAPDSFIQASKQILDTRTKYAGIYAQDSWRVTPNLTLNYGVRWDLIQPWYDTGNKIETLVPGEQSVLFPGAPPGWVVPGDPGIPRTLAPTQYHNFSPRLGLAYSPNWDSGLLAKLSGGPGKLSIRAGYGIFYTSVEDLTQFQEIGDPPYGLFWYAGSTRFELPYLDRATGASGPQRFPFTFPPANVSATNPDTSFDWAAVEPLSGALAYQRTNVTPYSEDYELSLQRQFGNNTVLSVNYVGTQGHHLITEHEANPANAALCLQLNELGASPGCGPFGEGSTFTLPPGVNYPAAATPNVEAVPANECGTGSSSSGAQCVVNTTYTVLGSLFGNNPYESTIAQSSFNSLQASLRHKSTLADFMLSYTYSKCMDDASGLQEGVNPFVPRESMSLCAFDLTQNFVASYDVRVPFDRIFHANGWARKIQDGWAISGITTFATGLPVGITETDDNSLTGTQLSEAPYDLPTYDPSGGPLYVDKNPRDRQPYFNNIIDGSGVTGGIFNYEALGTIGNARRRFFHGPGLNNWDLAVLKDTKITETKSLELRFEGFNMWNHAQFGGPNGNINSGSFGMIFGAGGPRIIQLGAKILF